MPSRPVAVLIVLGWLAALGWFTHRELWTVLFPDQAPPFVIDLGDEVTSQLGNDRRRADEPPLSPLDTQLRRPEVLWGIYRHDERAGGDVRIGRAETRLRYFEDDNTFEMETRIVNLEPNKSPLVQISIPGMFNTYRIDRHGEFRGMSVYGLLKFSFFGSQPVEIWIKLTGDLWDGKVVWTGRLDISGYGSVVPKIEPTEAPKGSVLNPLHPLPKIKNLRPGRRWRMPVIDPLADVVEPAITAALKKFLPGQNIDVKKLLTARPAFMDAEVLTDTVNVDFNREPHPCRVLEFRSEGNLARTYVRVSDGAVLRQEATTRGEQIVLQRE